MSSIIKASKEADPETRLHKAIKDFETALTKSQKKDLHAFTQTYPPSEKDVMTLTAIIDEDFSAKIHRGSSYGPRLTAFLNTVQQFAAIGDIIIGGSQNLIACGVWSIVRFSIMALVSTNSFFEEVSEMIMSIGRSSPRHEMIALLHPDSKELKRCVLEYFIQVVILFQKLIEFVQKSKLGQLASTIGSKDMKALHSSVEFWTNEIQREAGALQMRTIQEEAKENKRFRNRLFKDLTLVSIYHEQRAKDNVLNACTKYNHEAAWKYLRSRGYTTLLKDNDQYQKWRDSFSGTLLYAGKLGSGKSVLLANMVSDLVLHVANQSYLTAPVAYFFCQPDETESLTARTIIGSLARQLLESITNLQPFSEDADANTLLDTDKISELLRKRLPLGTHAYIIVDGLDECPLHEKEMACSALQKLQQFLNVSLCVSYRYEAGTKNPTEPNFLKILQPSNFASMEENNADIKTFILHELADRLETGRLLLGDPTLVIDIRDALLEGSQGMFLWVALQIDTLCLMETDASICEALKDLPRTLTETYSRILRKCGGTSSPYQRKILDIVTAANRPLTTDELREALSVTPGDSVWNPSKLLTDVFSTLTCCGSLIIVNEMELKVHLVHPSVKQFLLSTYKPDYRFFALANEVMLEVIVTYLNYGVFGTQVSREVVPHIMAQSTVARVLESTNSPAGLAAALKLLKIGKSRDYDVGKNLYDTLGERNAPTAHTFHFHEYATKMWLGHL
ncbi:hypothetical protein BT63DRAFT_356449, partial [Microthyrium microscopicum]